VHRYHFVEVRREIGNLRGARRGTSEEMADSVQDLSEASGESEVEYMAGGGCRVEGRSRKRPVIYTFRATCYIYT
jgi:hypothetical protein